MSSSAQLRLADEDDAQQLLGGRLEVREQAQLLQDLDAERLRLVDDDDAAAPRLVLRQQVTVQLLEQLLAALACGREAELGVDRLQQLERRQRRVEDVGGVDLGPELRQEGAQQGGLAGADVAR